jgi:hypothetical protein
MNTRLGAVGSAAIIAVAVLGGCSSGSPSSKGTSATTGIAGAPATNSLQMTLNGTKHTVSVACIRHGDAINASGVKNGYSANVTVQGANNSFAVVVQTTPAGQRTIAQAINGLRDSTGKAVGKLTVTTNGDKYSGDGTFVLTVLDPAGKAVKTNAAQTATGAFALDCSNGYASPPTTSSTSSTTTTRGSTTSTTR